jgi:hypothetical protein
MRTRADALHTCAQSRSLRSIIILCGALKAIYEWPCFDAARSGRGLTFTLISDQKLLDELIMLMISTIRDICLSPLPSIVKEKWQLLVNSETKILKFVFGT